MMERLQKVLARAGVDSRRKCEEYITSGRVTVDGKMVRELGTKVDPETQVIRCDGQLIRSEPPIHFLLNKPRGFICSAVRQGDIPSVMEIFKGVSQRLFTVGRLDADSEGMIIVTNDGELANRLAHPRYQVAKEYVVEVNGTITQEALAKLKKGVHLSDGVVRFDSIRAKSMGRGRAIAHVVLREGLNREIRRAFAALDMDVRRLRRVAVGPLRDDTLKPGQFRTLTAREIELLKKESGLGQGKK